MMESTKHLVAMYTNVVTINNLDTDGQKLFITLLNRIVTIVFDGQTTSINGKRFVIIVIPLDKNYFDCILDIQKGFNWKYFYYATCVLDQVLCQFLTLCTRDRRFQSL